MASGWAGPGTGQGRSRARSLIGPAPLAPFTQWWGTPEHRLGISGQTPDGEPLGILVTADSPHPGEAEALSITVFGAVADQPARTGTGRYDTGERRGSLNSTSS